MFRGPRASRVSPWQVTLIAMFVVLSVLVIWQRRVLQYSTPSGEEPSFTKLVWVSNHGFPPLLSTSTPEPPEAALHQPPRRLADTREPVRLALSDIAAILSRSPPQ